MKALQLEDTTIKIRGYTFRAVAVPSLTITTLYQTYFVKSKDFLKSYYLFKIVAAIRDILPAIYLGILGYTFAIKEGFGA